MKRITALIILLGLCASLFTGCASTGTTVKINLANSNYTVRENTTLPLGDSSASGTTADYLGKYMDAISAAIESVPAKAYTFDFSEVEFVTEEEARNYLIPALTEKYGEDRVIEKSSLKNIGIWALPSAEGYENDLKEIWISAYENADKQLEFVVDILRESQTLRNLRFVESGNGKLTEKSNNLTPNYDGAEPAVSTPLVAEETSSEKTLYFGGRIQKAGIFEKPLLNTIDFAMMITGSPVEGGSLPGGFAGGFEGTVTIDGQSFPLTLDGAGMSIPVGMVTDPSQYYIAFSVVGIANPQDTTSYRNVYFIKKDLTSVVGLYSFYNSSAYADWFETSRITSNTFNALISENNEKLTALYSKVIVDTYGNRMEYNNTLAVLYNMFIGVDLNYLKPNLKKGIASVSKDLRDYRDAINDSTIANKGENGLYFFPNGRSMVVRIFAYDGTTAIAAVDFSSMQDDGYGGLYSAEYTADGWILKTLLNTRIK